MEVKRLFDFMAKQLAEFPQEKSFGSIDNGKITYYSSADMMGMAKKLASGFIDMGLKKGDKVAMVSYRNRPEWTVVDLATQLLGIISVPVYPTISPREYTYIFNEAEVSYVFVGKDDLYDKVKEAQKNVKSIKSIFCFDKQADKPFWKDAFNDKNIEKVEEISKTIVEDDLVTFIYTSGTTGDPKGVMLTHSNIVSNVFAVQNAMPVGKGKTVLSFLPLCHVFERVASFTYMKKGANVVFAGLDNLGGEDGDLRKVKPVFFTCVPRLLEKVYEKIYNKGLALSGVKKALFFWALRLTDHYQLDQKPSGLDKMKWSIADKLIFSKWREALGGNLVGIFTGAAACPPHLIRIFSAAGIAIREGYGLTEASPGVAVNTFEPGEAVIGTVGRALDGMEVVIDVDEELYGPGAGEILVAGPNVMQGYHKKPKQTAEAIRIQDGKRWLCTGDVGKFIQGPGNQPFLKITDRKKELLKTSGGKYIAPAPLENSLKESQFVEQAMIVGNNRRFVSALIIPAEEALKKWFEYKGNTWTNRADACKQEIVQDKFNRIISEINPNFAKYEQIKKFELIPDSWVPVKDSDEEAELTPTLKLKRRIILNKYKDLIDGIYEDVL